MFSDCAECALSPTKSQTDETKIEKNHFATVNNECLSEKTTNYNAGAGI